MDAPPQVEVEGRRRGVRHHLRARLLTGLFVIFPVGFTIWILYILFRFLDGILSPVIDPLVGFHIPGLGLLAVVAALFGLRITAVFSPSRKGIVPSALFSVRITVCSS